MEYPWFVHLTEAHGERKIVVSQECRPNSQLLGLAKTVDGAVKLLWERLFDEEVDK